MAKGFAIGIPCDNYVKYQVYYWPESRKKAKYRTGQGENQMSKRRILVVEDEKDIADLVGLHLRDLCGELVTAIDGYDGMHLAMTSDWDLIILDLRLPGPDGLEICRAIRRERPYQPVLPPMLTRR